MLCYVMLCHVMLCMFIYLYRNLMNLIMTTRREVTGMMGMDVNGQDSGNDCGKTQVRESIGKMGCSTVERNNKHRIWIQQKIGHLDLKRNDESRYTKTDGNIGTAIWILSNKHSHLLHFLSYVLKHTSIRCQKFKQPKNGDLTRPKKDLT